MNPDGAPADAATEAGARSGGEAEARRVEALFRASGALRSGHFQLKSGRHGTSYLEKFQVLQHPAAVSELCGLIAHRVRPVDGPTAVDVVVGPTTGGVILAFETARQLGTPGFFAEEVRGPAGATRRAFRRGFRLEPGQRVLLVDDILTTGGSLLAMLPPIEAAGAELLKAVVLVDRAGGSRSVTSPTSGRTYAVEALWVLDLPTYEPGAATCPACADGLRLEVPGSSGTGPT
ncbi:MAG: phosphoribosyltransferase family protein [Candidatus Limnocylindrales bacterium]